MLRTFWFVVQSIDTNILVLCWPSPFHCGRAGIDSDKILWRKTYVIAICYTLVTMPIPIILPKISDDEYENVVIFWVVEKASTPGGGYSICLLGRRPPKQTLILILHKLICLPKNFPDDKSLMLSYFLGCDRSISDQEFVTFIGQKCPGWESVTFRWRIHVMSSYFELWKSCLRP